MKFLIAIYGHPEYYPPTLNAVAELSKYATEIDLVGRNVKHSEWDYPSNVRVTLTGNFHEVKAVQASGFVKKIKFFKQFVFTLYNHIKTNKPDWIICYDAIPLLAFRLVKWMFKRPPRLWYHNHDVMKLGDMTKYSVGWFAVKSERQFFKQVQVFTLPAIERKQYFPFENFKGKFFLIPNFPSISFYRQFQRSKLNGHVHLIYQGTICDGHGLEEFIRLIKNADQFIELTMVGNIHADYKRKLNDLVRELGVSEKVHLLDPVNYAKLPMITSRAQIGIAVNKPNDIMYATGGTASNKIYEYAALGLPIFYYDSEHYNHHLSKYKWAIPTSLVLDEMDKKINYIKQEHESLSKAALEDFETELNFEAHFKPVLEYVFRSGGLQKNND